MKVKRSKSIVRSTDRVTIHDVAEKAGVSIATISNVLNRSGSVSQGTRQRVMRIVQEIGYLPDPRYRIMGRQRAGGAVRLDNIGFLAASVSPERVVNDPHYARLLWGVQEGCRLAELHLQLEALSTEEFLPRIVAEDRVDGVIVLGDCSDELLHRIAEHVPLVQINSQRPLMGAEAFRPDEVATIRRPLEYLRELGHRRIYYFAIHDEIPANEHLAARALAFDMLIQQASDPLPEARSFILPRRVKSMPDTAVDMLRQWSGCMPSAIVCGNDMYAFAFTEAARVLGISVPGQLSLIGVDDSVLATYSTPALTTVRQPFEAMGRAAVETLMRRLDSDSQDALGAVHTLDVELVIRESSGPIR